MKLLTTGNPKTAKGAKYGYSTAILHLAPFNLSGHQVCPHATDGCVAACLNTAGRGGIIKRGETTNSIQLARIARTRLLFADRGAFVAKLTREIAAHVKRSEALGLKPAVRLNGTSDITWESLAPALFNIFHDVQFYDYTKSHLRVARWLAGKLPDNYHLTFSRSESNSGQARDLALRGARVAIVAADAGSALMWCQSQGLAPVVVSGDDSDLRFLDTESVVWLTPKGKARKDTSGFVVSPAHLAVR